MVVSKVKRSTRQGLQPVRNINECQWRTMDDTVAHRFCKLRVGGSNPSTGSN